MKFLFALALLLSYWTFYGQLDPKMEKAFGLDDQIKLGAKFDEIKDRVANSTEELPKIKWLDIKTNGTVFLSVDLPIQEVKVLMNDNLVAKIQMRPAPHYPKTVDEEIISEFFGPPIEKAGDEKMYMLIWSNPKYTVTLNGGTMLSMNYIYLEKTGSSSK